MTREELHERIASALSNEFKLEEMPVMANLLSNFSEEDINATAKILMGKYGLEDTSVQSEVRTDGDPA